MALRKRDTPTAEQNPDSTTSDSNSPQKKSSKQTQAPKPTNLLGKGSVVFVIGVGILAVIFLKSTMTFNKAGKDDVSNYRPVQAKDDKTSKINWQTFRDDAKKPIKLLTDDDIKYVDGGKMYLVVAGHVFDVTSGGKMYEPGSGYHGFIGRDASRAFVTGEFENDGLTPDLNGLKPDDMNGISDWINFYLNHKTYKFIGLHIGTFFGKDGKETSDLKSLRRSVIFAKEIKDKESKVEAVFPSCNIEWTAVDGSRLWCSTQSGGVNRDWAGYPRIFKDEGKEERCACVDKVNLNDKRLKQYKNCNPDSYECKIKE